MDLSYRITKAGYLIKSLPEAVTYHSKQTWHRIKAINDRTKRWGTMEYYLFIRHPEIFIQQLFKTELILFIFLIVAMGAWAFTGSILPAISWIIWSILSLIGVFMLDANRSKKYNFLLYALSRLFTFRYYYFHVIESLKHKSLSGISMTLSFSPQQTKYILQRETVKIWIVIITFFASVTVTTIGGLAFGLLH